MRLGFALRRSGCDTALGRNAAHGTRDAAKACLVALSAAKPIVALGNVASLAPKRRAALLAQELGTGP